MNLSTSLTDFKKISLIYPKSYTYIHPAHNKYVKIVDDYPEIAL